MKYVYTRLIDVAAAVSGGSLIEKEKSRVKMPALARAKHPLVAGVK